MDKTVLIDGTSLLSRAYLATPELRTSNGTPTNAIFGFLKLFEKIMKEVQPRYVAVAFDVPAPTFRHRMYAGYKATRKPMQEALAAQVPILKECLGLMNVRICELEGYEAVDLLGTMSKKFDSLNLIYTGDRVNQLPVFQAQKGGHIMLYSGNGGGFQLVDGKTQVCFTSKGVSDILTLTQENFEEKVGLRPGQIAGLKALMGDASDNIPGVVGIAETTARKLLAEYGSLEGIYASVGETKGPLRRKLEYGRDSAFLSYRLATIDRDAPIETKLSDCEFRFPFSAAVRRKFISLDLRQFYEKDELFVPAESVPSDIMEHAVTDPGCEYMSARDEDSVSVPRHKSSGSIPTGKERGKVPVVPIPERREGQQVSMGLHVTAGDYRRILVIDTETTWDDRVMSVGAVIADGVTMHSVEMRYYVIDPEYRDDGMYSDELFLKDAVAPAVCSREEAVNDLRQCCARHGVREAFAYNAAFDRSHLPEFSFLRWHDIMQVAAYVQYNTKIPRDADVWSTGRLKRGYGVEPMLRLLSGDWTYLETHNAVLDAADELRIMMLLGYPPAEYPAMK